MCWVSAIEDHVYAHVMRPVTVQFLKNPDIIHWGFEASYLGEDDYGTWISVPKGTLRWKGDIRVRPTRENAVFLSPRNGWWHLHYNGTTTKFSHFVDVATPPVWSSENRYEMVDLDLDLARAQNGDVHVEDEDEFEIHQIKYGYTEEMIDRAVQETALIVAALKNREEPFFETAAEWLTKV